RKHQGTRDEPPAILLPAFQSREVKQIYVFPLPHHFLAVAFVDALRKERSQLRQFRQHFDFVEQPLRRLHLQESLNPLRHFLERVHFKRQFHPSHASKRIDQQRHPRPFRLFKQQRHILRTLGV